jgi:ferrous iron transport protein B
MIVSVIVSIKEIVAKGRDFPWPRPDVCPRCHGHRVWGHGFVAAFFDGFAAKEVVVSTLGTAYSLGKVEPDASESLAERLRNEPNWNALTAFSLIVFVMLYAPCFVTLVVMRRETGSWKWPAFAMGYSTVLAYEVAFTVSSIVFLGN